MPATDLWWWQLWVQKGFGGPKPLPRAYWGLSPPASFLALWRMSPNTQWADGMVCLTRTWTFSDEPAKPTGSDLRGQAEYEYGKGRHWD